MTETLAEKYSHTYCFNKHFGSVVQFVEYDMKIYRSMNCTSENLCSLKIRQSFNFVI